MSERISSCSAGPTLIGALITYLLFGLLLSQLANYVQTIAATDRLALRCLVALVMVIECLHIFFATQSTWRVLVEAFTEPMKMVVQSKTGLSTAFLNASVALAVEAFFAWRIYSLTSDERINEWFSLSVVAKFLAMLPFVIILLALLQFGAAVGMAVEFIRIGRRIQDVYKIKLPISIHLGAQLASDTLITLGMVINLTKFKKRTRLKRTKSMLNRLVLHTVENGLITTLCASGNLIMCLVNVPGLIAAAFHYVLGILYGIVLMTTLNRRQDYRQFDNGDITLELNLPPTDILNPSSTVTRARTMQDAETRIASSLTPVRISLRQMVESDANPKP
ncbi:hypothetical protein EST38_g11189 [Candolleomyces aberdarensis]|uniref:DUF6534 domain-containing protein n=1 Tax=Candolleomyces aberdarensis TaxID=2316362 RepID=A0A4Q2D8S1_9AGAR|nr:hypothetical protein EST38_g11189 [Candolleomyces aberdarensis]